MRRQTKEQLKTIQSFFNMNPTDRRKSFLDEQIQNFINRGGRIEKQAPGFDLDMPTDQANDADILLMGV